MSSCIGLVNCLLGSPLLLKSSLTTLPTLSPTARISKTRAARSAPSVGAVLAASAPRLLRKYSSVWQAPGGRGNSCDLASSELLSCIDAPRTAVIAFSVAAMSACWSADFGFSLQMNEILCAWNS